TPKADSCGGTPITVTITVIPVPVLTVTPATQTICSGTATSIALTSNIVGTPILVTVTVNPVPVLIATPPSQTLCSFGSTSITLTSNVTGTTYAWTDVQTGVTGATSGSGSTIVQTLSTTGNTTGTAIYTITPTADGCSGTPIKDTVTVNPIPVVTASPVSQTFCSGGTTSIALTSNVAGAIFSW